MNRFKIPRLLIISALAIIFFCFIGCSKALNTAEAKTVKKQEPLRIYSIIDDGETKALTDLFTQKTGIPVVYLRASTGELVNRVISEKNDPQADVLLGGASSYHIQLDAQGALETYISKAVKDIPSYAKSQDGTWTGFCVLTLGIGINKDRYNSKFADIPYPKTWEDLLNPAYKGEIVITNPVSSSTAYLFVQGQLQRLGEQKGWEYLKALTPLVGQFPDSGSAPAKLVGTGEYALGVSYLHAIAKYRAQGFKVEMVAPDQTVGDVDCVSILKNCKNKETAQLFVDFMLSKEAQELMGSISYTIPVNSEAETAEGSVPVSSLNLIEYDASKASNQKDTVLEKWKEIVK